MQKFLLLIISLVVIGFTALISVPDSPYLIGGKTQADISALYPTPITPTGFTFSIWSIIYLSWIVSGVYIAFFEKKRSHSLKKVVLWFVFTMVLTALWLVPWGLEWMGIALLVMLVLLGSLWYTFFLSRKEGKILSSSIELTMGWIHIATFANLAVWLKYLGYISADTSLIWGISILSLAFVATLIFEVRFRAHIVSLVFLWASLGIYFGQPITLQTQILVVYDFIVFLSVLSQALRR